MKIHYGEISFMEMKILMNVHNYKHILVHVINNFTLSHMLKHCSGPFVGTCMYVFFFVDVCMYVMCYMSLYACM